MITSYEVGSVFKAVDEFTPQLRRMTQSLFKFSADVLKVKEQAAYLGTMKFTGSMEALRGLNMEFKKVGEQSAIAKTAIVSNFVKADEGIATTIRSVEKLKTQLAETKGIMRNMRMPGAGRAGMHAGGGGGHGFGGHAAAAGIGGFIGAEGIFHSGEEVIKHGMALEHWKQQLVAAGNTSKEVAGAVNASWALAGRNFNTTAAENLKNITELNKATGNLGESTRLLPTFSIAENILHSVKSEAVGHKFSHNSTQTLNFARGLEELGVTQMGKTEEEREASIKKYVYEYAKTMIASRGLFDGNALYAMTNNSGGAAQNWDLRMATTVAPVLGEIMKSSKFGNADYMALKSYQGGHITSDAAGALVKYHLAKLGDESDPNADVYLDEKKKYHLKANSNFAKGMDTNIWDWSTRTLEVLKANPITQAGKHVDIANQHDMNAMVNEIGSNKSTSMLLRAILEPLTRLQMTKEFAMRDKVPGDAVGILQENDPWMKVDALKKKWDDFLTALGGPLIDPAMKALDTMTIGLTKVTAWAKDHPETVKLLAEGLAGAAVALTGVAVVGAAAMLGTGGLVAGAIAAVAGAITMLAALNWKAVADGLQSLWSKITSFLPTLPRLPKPAQREQSDLFGLESYSGANDNSGGSLIRAALSGTNGQGRIVAGTIAGGISNSNVIVLAGGASGLGGLGDIGGGGSGGLIRASYGGGGTGGRIIGASFGPTAGEGGSRSWRNNNPGNIEFGSFARSMGAVGSDGRFARFASYDAGRRAQERLLFDSPGYRNLTLGQAIRKWAPGSENNVPAYLRAMGGGGSLPMHAYSPAQRARLLDNMQRHEGWTPGRRSPAAGPPPIRKQHHHHFKLELDGKQLEARLTHRQAERGEFPTAVGGPDTHGDFASPEAYLHDVA